MKTIRTLLSAATIAVASAPGAHAQALTVETGTASGSTTLAMQVIATYGKIDLQINTGQTLTKACMKLGQAQIDAAVCPPPAHRAMMAGVGPFRNDAETAKAASQNIRSLFAFSGGFFHAIVRDGSGVETWDDLAGLRVFTGPPAGTANSQSQAIIKAASGLIAGEDYEAVRLGWGAAMQGFQDGQFDVMMFPTSVGNAALEQLGAIHLMTLPDEALETETWIEYTKQESRDVGMIPAGVYSNVLTETPVRTAEYTMQAAVHMGMDDDTAYRMTKAFWDNLAEAKKNIRVLATINPDEPFKGLSAKLHPGAVRYYKEIGIEVPTNLM
ncbi:MAG: TAXI family TRAP transporter solute-binding subunit [Pseudomonadota bacterium]